MPTATSQTSATEAGCALLLLLSLIASPCSVRAAIDAKGESSPTPAVADSKALQPQEARFRESKGVSIGDKVEYHDDHAKPITFDEFQAQLPTAKQLKVLRRTQGIPNAQGQMTTGETTVIFTLSHQEGRTEKPKYKVNPGDAFPAFQLQGLGGEVVDNTSLKGRYTLVNFFFAACAPCVAELPLLNAFADKNPALQFLAVTFDASEVARKFVATHPFGWKVVPNARSLIDQVGIKAYPSFVLLDPAGKVVEFKLGLDIEKDNALGKWISSVNIGKALP